MQEPFDEAGSAPLADELVVGPGSSSDSDVDEDEFRLLADELAQLESPPHSPVMTGSNSRTISTERVDLFSSFDDAGSTSGGATRLTRAISLDPSSPLLPDGNHSTNDNAPIATHELHTRLQDQLQRDLSDGEIHDIQSLLSSQRMSGISQDVLQQVLTLIETSQIEVLNSSSTSIRSINTTPNTSHHRASHHRHTSSGGDIDPVAKLAQVLQCEHVLPSLRFLRSPSSLHRGSTGGISYATRGRSDSSASEESKTSSTTLIRVSTGSPTISAVDAHRHSLSVSLSSSVYTPPTRRRGSTSSDASPYHEPLSPFPQQPVTPSSASAGAALQKLQKEYQRLSNSFRLLKSHNARTEESLAQSQISLTQVNEELKLRCSELEEEQLARQEAMKRESSLQVTLVTKDRLLTSLQSDNTSLKTSLSQIRRKEEILRSAKEKYETQLVHARRRSVMELEHVREELLQASSNRMIRLNEEKVHLQHALQDLEQQFLKFQKQQQEEQRQAEQEEEEEAARVEEDRKGRRQHSRGSSSGGSSGAFSPSDFTRARQHPRHPSLGSGALWDYLHSMQQRMNGIGGSVSSGNGSNTNSIDLSMNSRPRHGGLSEDLAVDEEEQNNHNDNHNIAIEHNAKKSETIQQPIETGSNMTPSLQTDTNNTPNQPSTTVDTPLTMRVDAHTQTDDARNIDANDNPTDSSSVSSSPVDPASSPSAPPDSSLSSVKAGKKARRGQIPSTPDVSRAPLSDTSIDPLVHRRLQDELVELRRELEQMRSAAAMPSPTPITPTEHALRTPILRAKPKLIGVGANLPPSSAPTPTNTTNAVGVDTIVGVDPTDSMAHHRSVSSPSSSSIAIGGGIDSTPAAVTPSGGGGDRPTRKPMQRNAPPEAQARFFPNNNNNPTNSTPSVATPSNPPTLAIPPIILPSDSPISPAGASSPLSGLTPQQAYDLGYSRGVDSCDKNAKKNASMRSHTVRTAGTVKDVQQSRNEETSTTTNKVKKAANTMTSPSNSISVDSTPPSHRPSSSHGRMETPPDAMVESTPLIRLQIPMPIGGGDMYDPETIAACASDSIVLECVLPGPTVLDPPVAPLSVSDSHPAAHAAPTSAATAAPKNKKARAKAAKQAANMPPTPTPATTINTNSTVTNSATRKATNQTEPAPATGVDNNKPQISSSESVDNVGLSSSNPSLPTIDLTALEFDSPHAPSSSSPATVGSSVATTPAAAAGKKKKKGKKKHGSTDVSAAAASRTSPSFTSHPISRTFATELRRIATSEPTPDEIEQARQTVKAVPYHQIIQPIQCSIL